MGSHKQQRFTGQLPDDGFHLFPAEHRHSVRFLVITAQLRKYFIEGHPDGDRKAQFLFDPLSDLFSNLPAVPKQLLAAVDVQPAFIQAEALHPVGITTVNLLGTG